MNVLQVGRAELLSELIYSVHSDQASMENMEYCVLCANMYLKHYVMSIEKLAICHETKS